MFGNVNIGILGTGTMAGRMAQTLKNVRRAKPYAVGSRDLDRAVDFAKKYGFRRAYGTYEDMLLDKKVDLVYIATPHTEHYENAKLAVSCGKNVIVEKPFCVNAKQAKDLIALAEEKNVFITEAMWTRYTPFAAKVREVLGSGIIGDPVSLTADASWNTAAVPRMTDPELAGGTLLDTGVYALNFASMMFGDDILKINATCTYTDRHLDEQDAIALVYRDGRMANLTASMLGSSGRQGVITGTKGYMVIDDISNFKSLQVFDESGKKVASYRRPKQKTGYEYELRSAVRAVSEGKLECYEMPHAKTISLMHMLDFVREQMGIIYPFEAREKIEEQKRKQAEERAAAAAIEEKAKEALAVKEEEEERGQIASDIQAQEAIEGHVPVGDDTDYTYGTAQAAVDAAGADFTLPSEDTLVRAMDAAVKEDEEIRKAEEKKAREKEDEKPDDRWDKSSLPETSDVGDVTEYIDLAHLSGRMRQAEEMAKKDSSSDTAENAAAPVSAPKEAEGMTEEEPGKDEGETETPEEEKKDADDAEDTVEGTAKDHAAKVLPIEAGDAKEGAAGEKKSGEDDPESDHQDASDAPL